MDTKGLPFAKVPHRCAEQLGFGRGDKPRRKNKWSTGDKTLADLNRESVILVQVE